jgi:peptidoglycan/LPS O-acetylase OafA/YrhL
MWSLSVEERFYLIAPMILLLVPKKQLPLVLGVLCLAAIAFRYAFQPNIEAMELVLPARMDSLVMGVGVAFIQHTVDLTRFSQMWRALLLAIPLVYLPVLVMTSGKDFVLAHTFFAAITAVYMLCVLSCPGVNSIFRARWLAFLANISYGIYLFHEPVNVLLTGTLLGKTVYMPGLDRIFVTLVSLAATVGLAVLSRRYFENPILQWESQIAPRADRRAEQCAVQ